MNGRNELGHVVVVRGASASGRAVVRAVVHEGGNASVLDRRTSVSGAPAYKVDLRDAGMTSRAVDELTRALGPVTGVVLFASTDRYPPAGMRPQPRWERALAEELIEVASILRATTPAFGSRPARMVLVEGPHPKVSGRPVRRSADEVVAALARGLLGELAPQIELRTVRFVVSHESSLPLQVLTALRSEPDVDDAAVRSAAGTAGRPFR